jgi:hypothetical protein
MVFDSDMVEYCNKVERSSKSRHPVKLETHGQLTKNDVLIPEFMPLLPEAYTYAKTPVR